MAHLEKELSAFVFCLKYLKLFYIHRRTMNNKLTTTVALATAEMVSLTTVRFGKYIDEKLKTEYFNDGTEERIGTGSLQRKIARTETERSTAHHSKFSIAPSCEGTSINPIEFSSLM